jgi:fructose-1,6-bisphosphatase/inositol monophosphatase family enzyme
MLQKNNIIEFLLLLGDTVLAVVSAELQKQVAERISVVFEGEDDVIFSIDKNVEDKLLPVLESRAAELGGIELVAEGIYNRKFPSPDGKYKWKLIVDPIDGTRGIMYDKRPAFFLAGIAENKREKATLQDIEFAVLLELPVSKSIYSDRFWAARGKGWGAERKVILGEKAGDTLPLNASPSKAKNLIGGFAQLSRFFPPGKRLLAGIEEDLMNSLLSEQDMNKAIVFEDQYICSGGQLYELLCGHDRFTAELRGLLERYLNKKGQKFGLTCHPYDVCAHLIGIEAGLIITDESGEALDAPFDTTTSVNWLGYANRDIHDLVWPVLKEILIKEELL